MSLTRVEDDAPWDSEGFRRDLKGLLNSYSMENGSNTPDGILADYLLACLDAFDKAVNTRHKWFGHPEPFMVE